MDTKKIFLMVIVLSANARAENLEVALINLKQNLNNLEKVFNFKVAPKKTVDQPSKSQGTATGLKSGSIPIVLIGAASKLLPTIQINFPKEFTYQSISLEELTKVVADKALIMINRTSGRLQHVLPSQKELVAIIQNVKQPIFMIFNIASDSASISNNPMSKHEIKATVEKKVLDEEKAPLAENIVKKMKAKLPNVKGFPFWYDNNFNILTGPQAEYESNIQEIQKLLLSN